MLPTEWSLKKNGTGVGDNGSVGVVLPISKLDYIWEMMRSGFVLNYSAFTCFCSFRITNSVQHTAHCHFFSSVSRSQTVCLGLTRPASPLFSASGLLLRRAARTVLAAQQWGGTTYLSG